jgi:hypothetical protein
MQLRRRRRIGCEYLIAMETNYGPLRTKTNIQFSSGSGFIME